MNDFLSQSAIISSNPINFFESFFALILAGIFGSLISNSYKNSCQSIAGGRQITSSLLPLTLTICVIITVVKSSLALSLGLVGALSIVRFRTPIKDPEDLIYLFIAIVTGLGFGAHQNLFTAISISSILLILNIRPYIYKKKSKKFKNENDININLEWSQDLGISFQEIVSKISLYSNGIDFIRYEKSIESNNLLLKVDLGKHSLDEILYSINEINTKISINVYNSFIDY